MDSDPDSGRGCCTGWSITNGGVCRVATPKPKPQIFCPKKQARIFPIRLGRENGAGDKTLRVQPKKGSLFRPGRPEHYPRPKRGILVAITVMKGTLDSSGNPAM